MAFDSLYTGITGLNAYQSWIDMISNNIANTSTTGYKGQRMTFADLFYQQTGAPSGPSANSGGVNPIDQGLGVKVNTVDTEFAQGGLQTTGINTDLALNGDGFFILSTPSGGNPVYTRDGAFSLNENGLLYDPASGLAVQGYMANSSGQITTTGVPGDINIPIGEGEQATATGSGVKVGPNTNDDVFDMQVGGNLDQTDWSQQFLYQVGASVTPGAPDTVSTTLYDSLGNSHQISMTYTPYTGGATTATASVPGTAGAGGQAITATPTVYGANSIATTITVTGNGTSFNIKDAQGNTTTAAAGSTVTFDGATMTLNASAAANVSGTTKLTAATNGLPSQVDNAEGVAESVGSCWAVTAASTDGTTFQTITSPATYAAGTVTAGTYANNSTSGIIGYVYFNKQGQYINTSSVASTTADPLTGVSLTGSVAKGFIHAEGGGTPSVQQGNQLNVTAWGPGAGNPSQAPTSGSPAGLTPTPGPIGIDFSQNASLAGNYTANVLSQNGYAAGILSNITVGQDGTVTGSFTNGQTKTVAQLAIARFQNEQGLQRLGGNQFGETAASGLAQVGTADSGAYGQIVAGALEQSNVNLANEFTNLIVAQRAFEANSRGIETADQNLITLVNLRATEN